MIHISPRRFWPPARHISGASLLAILSAVLFFANFPDAVADPREVIFEKSYCATERGKTVPVVRSNNSIPMAERRGEHAVILLNFNDLRHLNRETARFLFTRACFEASAMASGRWVDNLECQALKFIAKRDRGVFGNVDEIVSDLHRMDSKEAYIIASGLYEC